MIFSPADARSSFQELDLFNSGYEYYLSYQPAKAEKEFETFLTKFPDSSVRDAVMFWLGKSSVQLRDFEEAKKTFFALMQQFPESPYVKYVKKELEELDKLSSEGRGGTPARGIEAVGAERSEIRDIRDGDTGDKVAPSEKTEQQKTDEITDPAKFQKEVSPAEPGGINKGTSEDAGSAHLGSTEIVDAGTRNEVSDAKDESTEEKEPVDSTLQQGTNGESAPEKVEREASVQTVKMDTTSSGNKDDVASGISETAAPENKIDRKVELSGADVEGHEEAAVHGTDSFYVLSKLDIKDVLWRNGIASEDIEDEKILYGEAQRLNISADTAALDELILQYGFSSGQAAYLRRFLAICELLSRRLKDLPEEKLLESLIVRYEEGNKYRKIVISPELQKEAKKGVPFGDIKKLYPDLVSVVITGYDFVEPQLKEKMRYLQNDEIGVIWSEEGYTIIKPVLKKLSCKPFEEAGPGVREKIKTLITGLLTDLKAQKNK